MDQLTLNAVDWSSWLRLEAIPNDERSSEEALRAAMRSVRRSLRGPDEDRAAADSFDTLPPALRPTIAVGCFAVDPERFSDVLARSLREASGQEREEIRQQILQRAFPDGGLRWYGEVTVDHPQDLLAAPVPPLRDEVPELERMPPVPGEVLWGLRQPEPSELQPRRATSHYAEALPRIMGTILPVPARPLPVALSRTFSADEVAELAPRLPRTIELDVAADPEFFALLDARFDGDPASPEGAARRLERDARAIADLVRKTASRGLGLDAFYHPRP